MKKHRVVFKEITKINSDSNAPNELALLIDYNDLYRYRTAKHLLSQSDWLTNISIAAPFVDMDQKDFIIGASEIVIFEDGKVYFRTFDKYNPKEIIEVDLKNKLDELSLEYPTPSSYMIARSIIKQAADKGLILKLDQVIEVANVFDIVRNQDPILTADEIDESIRSIIRKSLIPVVLSFNDNSKTLNIDFCPLKVDETNDLVEEYALKGLPFFYGYTKQELIDMIGKNNEETGEQWEVLEVDGITINNLKS